MRLRSTFGGVSISFLSFLNVIDWLQPAEITLSCIDRHLLFPQDFLHAEADTGRIAASHTRAFLLRRLSQVVAVLTAEHAANLAVLPEIALPAIRRPFFMVSNTVDHNCVSHLISSVSDRCFRNSSEQKHSGGLRKESVAVLCKTCYYLKLLGTTKTEIKAFIKAFERITEEYRNSVNAAVSSIVIRQDLSSRMAALKNFI